MAALMNLMPSHPMPDDIIEEILLRLPLKSIIRFKCVCKKWCGISESRYFIDTHYARSDEHMLVKHATEVKDSDAGEVVWDPREKEMFLTLYKDYISFSMPEPSLPPILEIALSRLDIRRLTLIGCSNGILCTQGFPDIILMNPSLRETKVFPWPGNHGYHFRLLGFGFDDVNRAFKLVRLEFMGTNAKPIASVYNLSTNSCKVLDSNSLDYQEQGYEQYSTLVSGFIHWCGHKGILKFNMTTDLFQYMQLPQGSGIEHADHMVFAWNQSLAVVAYAYYDAHAIIWIMEEYGVEESWTKLYFVNSISYPILKPLCLWSDDKLLFETIGGNIISYDFISNSASKISNIEVPSRYYYDNDLEIVGYKQSMFSLKKF